MSRRPNILFLLTDQHPAHLSGFAGDKVVRTQHLDALASRSVHCTSAVCASPICTPSRMCLLSGKEPHKSAAWNNHWMIFPEHTTWPQHFADNGYTTALIGKMHFGGKDQSQGFQHRPYGDLRHGLGHQPDPIDLFPGYAHVMSAGVSDIPESMMQDVVVARETLAFLREHQDEHPDKPWFTCASFGRPHSPFTAPSRYIRRYQGKVTLPDIPAGEPDNLEPFAKLGIDRGNPTREDELRALEAFYACTDFVDDCIGEVLTGLEQDGMLDNTIIIYTSDHGDMIGRHGLWGKKVYYDESVRVPFLISGPGVKPGSHDWAEPVSLLDMFPTTCKLAGLSIPEGLDGVDQSEAFSTLDPKKAPREYATSSFYYYGTRINYRAVPEDTPQRAMRLVRTRDWKYVQVEQGEELLFDLKNDPGETKNLVKKTELSERVKAMRGMLEKDFSWENVHQQLAADRLRVPEYLSGQRPSMPNQYTLRDGRICDAETGLYDARWLYIPPEATGGIIPQMEG